MIPLSSELPVASTLTVKSDFELVKDAEGGSLIVTVLVTVVLEEPSLSTTVNLTLKLPEAE